MGCDIHLYIETQNEDDTWTAVEAPPIKDEDNFDEWGRYASYNEPGVKEYQWAFGRSYFCFALLADVRNDGRCTPISSPKGVPPDASASVLGEYTYKVDDTREDEDGYTSRESADRWVERGYSKEIAPGVVTGPDWHSASHFTLADLEAVDLAAQGFDCEGYVNPQQYAEFKEKGRPSSWCKSVGGGGVVHITNGDMEKHIAAKGQHVYDLLQQSPYTLVRWSSTGADYARRIEDLRVEMRRIAAERSLSPDKVRTVFWFDN